MSCYIQCEVSQVINEHIYFFETNEEVVIIDPGFGSELIFDKYNIDKNKNIIILLTHGHFDHILGINKLIQNCNVKKIYVGEGDIPLLFDPIKNHSANHQNIVGHTKGGLFYKDDRARVIITGDSLQKGSIGVTTIEGVDIPLLKKNVKRFVENIPEDYLILPGHTDSTTIGNELANNPYLN